MYNKVLPFIFVHPVHYYKSNLDSLHVFGFNLKIMKIIMQKSCPVKLLKKLSLVSSA